MLKYINAVLISIVFLLLLGVFYLFTNKDNLVSTTWVCDQIKSGFISKSYTKYSHISESMILTFSSKSSFLINEFIQAQEGDDKYKLMELYYEGDYIQTREHLTLNFNRVRILKEHDDPNLNKAYKDYEGYSIYYRYKRIDNRLYFFTDSKNEAFDMVCYTDK
ncbi:hypothetical protein VAS14_06048 [Photobacterium angustum S14]|uniref:Lipoprotein n=1 Tax=Photobacterium angustum (strain S14 / CCUG 15956) TaxID=314292 RepID=Q1ZRR8_PHOAS|nr:hypothetical protein VAS14_06048 [Photobacterium angustum S14]